VSRIIAIANQKGGVGKTTTAINLATSLAAISKKVLVLDLDPQGNASTGLGVVQNKRFKNMYNVLAGEVDILDAILASEIPCLDIITSNVDLSAAEFELADLEKREFVVKNLLSAITDRYDYIIIDCPPSLGMLTINALTAADSIIVPLQCEFFALEGLSHLLKTVSLVQKKLNPNLKIEGIVLTMYDKRNKLTEQVEEDVRSCLKDLVYKTIIPRNVKLSEAPSHGKPAVVYDIKCNGSLAYVLLAKELLQRERNKEKISA